MSLYRGRVDVSVVAKNNRTTHLLTMCEPFVSSLTSHLAAAQPSCVLRGVLTVAGGRGGQSTLLENPTDGIRGQSPNP